MKAASSAPCNTAEFKDSVGKSPAHLPGAHASTVHATCLWSQFFDVLGRAKTSLAKFWHSLRTAPPGELPGPKGRVWPMPVPFPSLHRRGARRAQRDVARKLAFNATVLVLSWLYVDRSHFVGPAELGLGTPLNAEQWAVVRNLGSAISVWNAEPPVCPEAMGRSAAKVESCEAALNGIAEMLRPTKSPADPLAPSDRPIGDCLPSRVCGNLNLEPATVAQPVVADRLHFVGRPAFDPSPYLDAHTRAIYERPLDHAREIPEDEPVPRVRVRCDRSETLRLLKVLDDSGRLCLLPEVAGRERLDNGLFTVAKSLSRDRMVLDSRPANQAERAADRWIASMASLEQLQWMYLSPDEIMQASTEDLQEYYHCFIIGEQRCRRNILAVRVRPEEVSRLSCFREELRSQPVLRPALQTMAMGDSSAVAVAQTSHLSVILRSKALSLDRFVTLRGRPPRDGLVSGLLIDDLVVLEKLKKGSPPESAQAPGVMATIHAAYEEAHLPRHAGKSVAQAARTDFWGGSLDGERGTIRPNPKRTIPLSSLLLRTVELGASTPDLLEIFSGSLVSVFQSRRRLMSLLEKVYSEPKGLTGRAVFRLSAELKDELLCCIALIPQAVVDLRAEGAPVIVASDASSSREAAVVADVPSAVTVELCRHGLQKGLWSRLLKPLEALQRERGELADEEQLPGGAYSSHPLWETFCRSVQFRAFGKVRKAKARRHINLGELRAALAAEARVGRLWPNSRYVHLQDSQVSLACMVKGRSSSAALNATLRKSLPDHLGFNIRPALGFVKTHLNPADDPTRLKPLRAPCEDEPSWFTELLRGLRSLRLLPR